MIRNHHYSCVLKTGSMCICLLVHTMVSATACLAGLAAPENRHLAGIIAKMKADYAIVRDYQMEVEIKVYHEGKVAETEQFLYTFRKPDHIRIDMESPYKGMVLVYRGENGGVAVKPGGLFGFLTLHLSPDSSLLRNAAGQRIDQTDLGLLIQNIEHSLTDKRRGVIKVSELDRQLHIEVMAEDHFLRGVLTLYHFLIDKTRLLPTEVSEFTPDGIIKREVRFRNLRTSINAPESFFRIGGETDENAQPAR